MTFKPLHCWDCGARVISGDQGVYTLMTNFRQVRFHLADGSYCESPFCTDCIAKPWTPERVLAFEEAVNLVDPRHQIKILSVEGITMPRVNVLEPILLPVLDVTKLSRPPGV